MQSHVRKIVRSFLKFRVGLILGLGLFAFALRRWAGMKARGHAVSVLNPQPRAPWPLAGRYAEIRRRSGHELIDGISVTRPRYLHLPGRALGSARRFARCALRNLPACDVVVCDYA
jgi:hypothetical protein